MYHVHSTVRLLVSREGDIRSDDRHEQIHGTQNSIPLLGKREEERKEEEKRESKSKTYNQRTK
jgi:hypothetical protein